MRNLVHTNKFGTCIVELAMFQGEKWYEVFLPAYEEEIGNEYIGEVEFNESLDEVAAAIDRDLYKKYI